MARTSRVPTLGPLAVEIVSIVFAVTLALWLDGWIEDRETRRLVDAVLATIAEEVEANRESVEGSLAYHRTAVEEMRSFLDDARADASPEAMLSTVLPNGVRTAFLRSSAWNTAVMTGILPELPYELVRPLSWTYTLQERYDATTRDFMQAVYQALLGTDLVTRGTASGVASAIGPPLGDFITMEAELAEAYGHLAETLGTNAPPSEAAAGSDG